MFQLKREDVLRAYFECKRKKKETNSMLIFEFDLEKNITKLYLDILNNRYKVSKSSCIVVNISTKPREIWTGQFRDKIVHRLICNFLNEIYYDRFILNVFNGIIGRGTLLGALTAQCYAQDITDDYTKKGYFLKADISNFFNSIDKDILFEIIKRDVKDEWLINVIKKTIYNNPRKNAAFKPPKRILEKVSTQKRLHYYSNKKGLPIGNMASQYFANIYLNELDQYIKNELKFECYCRYADDMIFFHQKSGYLNYIYSKVNRFLEDKLALKLNKKKKCINLIEKGFDFIGYVIKQDRIHIRAKTINKSFYKIKEWKNNPNKFCEEELISLRDRVNGYLALANRTDNYNYRKALCAEVTGNLFISPNKDYNKIIIN